MRFVAWGGTTWFVQEDLPQEEARELALGPTPVWVRAEAVPEEVWKRLGEWFDLHPLALEDIQNVRQRPKVEDYPRITFAVVRVPRLEDGDVRWVQVGVFLGEGFVLTATRERVPELDAVESRMLAGRLDAGQGQVDRVFHRIVDAVVDAWFPYMDHLEDTLEDLEDVVIDRAERKELESIRDLKGMISKTRKVISPMRDAMLSLERSDHANIQPETRLYLRDVADHMIRLAERLDHVKEVALIAQETWNATLANQQNAVMKRLTVVAALLLVPALLAGIGGMNFDGFPTWDFWLVTGFIIGLTAVAALAAVIKGWL